MSPPARRGDPGTPPRSPDNAINTASHDVRDQPAQSTAGLHRRADAAYRLPPLRPCGGLAARDPWLPDQRTEAPSSFGLSAVELAAEARRLRRSGWTGDEVRRVIEEPAAEAGAS
ncbi:MAG: hypothetical protein EKK42_33165 [Pseudonocardiaceae bacterium]|nr:MAG: hypothetical protein EKK42_33165 [Pseudonocardiaceae bacterium]